jgi:hypothetical protein
VVRAFSRWETLKARVWVYRPFSGYGMALKIFWGYFMADVFHNRGIFFFQAGKWEERH